jgi:hypothetical protein
VAADSDNPPRAVAAARWCWATAAISAGALVVAAALAPATDARAGGLLAWLLFVSSSCHVAGTGWLGSLAEVRRLARARRGRLLVAPTALMAGAVLAVMVVKPGDLAWILLALFAWQLHHFQRQNLGLVALAASSSGLKRLLPAERRCIQLVGASAVVGVVAHPGLLQLHVRPGLGILFGVARVAYVAVLLVGLAVLSRRSPRERPLHFCALFAATMIFPLPLFVSSSPYAALAGMTIAHGLQYLVLLGLVAAGTERTQRGARLGTLAAVALVGGLVLSVTSHLHTSMTPVRMLFGLYVGVTAAHFVVDRGLWRLRDPLARELVRARAPMLLGASAVDRLPIDRLPI